VQSIHACNLYFLKRQLFMNKIVHMNNNKTIINQGLFMKKIIAISILSVGCSDIKSSALNTSGIHAEISAMVENGTTSVDVILRAGDANSLTYVELDEGDKLEATDGTDTNGLDHSNFGSIHSYDALFNQTDPGTEFTISLLRELEDDAPTSVATLTQDLTIILENDVHSQQDPLTIAWEASEPGDETLYLNASGSCIFSIKEEVPLSDGSYTINSSDFESTNDETQQESCELDIVLERRLVGTLDPAYGSGKVYGGVRKRTSIRLDP